jgi:hypothetical protein
MTRPNTKTLRKLAKSLRDKPVVAQQNIASRVAPVITAMAGSSYDGGQTVYGDARPTGVNGNALDLVVTGKTRSTVVFKAIGTIVRAVLGTKYARYLIGKYRILPIGNAAMPFSWQSRIRTIANEELSKHYADEIQRAA